MNQMVVRGVDKNYLKMTSPPDLEPLIQNTFTVPHNVHCQNCLNVSKMTTKALDKNYLKTNNSSWITGPTVK